MQYSTSISDCGNDVLEVNFSAWQQSLHQQCRAKCTTQTYSQPIDCWLWKETYRVTRKKFFFQALSCVTLWRLFNQMKSSQYARHTLHASLDQHLQIKYLVFWFNV